jgi:hypothetical protein
MERTHHISIFGSMVQGQQGMPVSDLHDIDSARNGEIQKGCFGGGSMENIGIAFLFDLNIAA